MQRPLRLALQALVVIVVLACLLAAAPSIALLRDARHGSARAKASGRGHPRSLRASLLGQWPTSGGRAIAALQGALRVSSGCDLAASASHAPWGGGDANASTATAAAAAAAAGPAAAVAVAVVSADAAPEQAVQVAQLVPEAVAAPSRSGLQLPEALLGRSSPSTPRQAGSVPAPAPAAPVEAQQQEPSALAEAPAQAEPEAALGSAGAAPRQPAGAPSGEPSPQQSQPEEQQPAEEVSCMVTLRVPKVALMFLTVGPIPHEQLWTEWLGAAAGLLPRASLLQPSAFCLRRCAPGGGGSCAQPECGAAAACHPACAAELARLHGGGTSGSSSGGSSSGGGVLRQQSLFSLYVHAKPGFTYPNGSLFAAAVAPRRVSTSWGSYSLVAAERRLLEAAVSDPANQFFVLLSETTAPLYPATLLWQQLMHEQKSKINACEGSGDQMARRWSPHMETATLKEHHWRKSSQWFFLMRRHAKQVVSDRDVRFSFSRHCRSGWDPLLKRERDCIADEHMIPTLLATLGEENATTCDASAATYLHWEGGPHPKAFAAQDISQGLIEHMRASRGERCGPARHRLAMEAAVQSFVRVADLVAPDMCSQALAAPGSNYSDPFAPVKLDAACALMARKFTPGSAASLLKLYRNCTAGLGVLACPAG